MWCQPFLFLLTMCSLGVATFDNPVRLTRTVSLNPFSTTHTQNDDLTEVTAVHVPPQDFGYYHFSPWSKNRYMLVLESHDSDPEWDQKPQDITMTKRQFGAWGGKRSDYIEAKDEIDSENLEKRQFKPWGGKRNSAFSQDLIPSLKRQFDPWGGKRGFNAWGGKRGFNAWGGKRGFNAWGGKRGFNAWGGKRGFNAWGGKRGFNAWGGKRGFNAWGGKRNFNAWGGKRNFNAWGGKRSFNAWGGK
ncbi:uncharacterized protein LOC111089718 [Limulus polyphemus]|uniref:Uncharacterized protein LOC111089718 n=1 Tax=Limulus polyphemus TaxID=6850 RepID=A0ABM1TR97_LIMPO|nr:uncharacterized protein LOC111089718 [Limulus polyphemus]